MITLTSQKCTHCGLCADLCHESCITLTDSGPVIDQATCTYFLQEAFPYSTG